MAENILSVEGPLNERASVPGYIGYYVIYRMADGQARLIQRDTYGEAHSSMYALNRMQGVVSASLYERKCLETWWPPAALVTFTTKEGSSQ